MPAGRHSVRGSRPPCRAVTVLVHVVGGDHGVATHVCIRNLAELRARVRAAGGQAAVARAAGVSEQRLSLLMTGARPRIGVALAARLEDTVKVARGALFVVDTPELVTPYTALTGTDG
jgi:DNA-binding phage protein